MIKKTVELSPEFKSHAGKAIAAIVVFFIVYILLFIFALVLTAICVYGGVILIISFPGLLTVLVGLGLASVGFFVLFFLFKFLFKTNKLDRSHLYEISEKDEPDLFNMITQIVKEVGTTFPKRIYLSSEVNAAVFYDSSFWSMILPIKKNLLIGMGLVNTITKDEFKAILSHEFGHFSQTTMKVGSYVYNVNQVIHNMLYENESYDHMIHKWANASGYFAIFVMIAVKLVQFIQWILKAIYGLLNRSYLALSREMEFNADEIAANVTGYPPLKSSLLRMNLADYSYNSVISFYEGRISENVKSKNIYKEQSHLIALAAREDHLPIVNGLPMVTLEELNKFNKSKLVISDQWASHPSTEDRIARLEKTKIVKDIQDNSLANDLFHNLSTYQETLTNGLFANVKYESTPMDYTIDIFKSEYEKEYVKNSLPKLFNRYYDNRNPSEINFNDIKSSDIIPSVDCLFSDQKVALCDEALAMQNDIDIIQRIADKTIDLKSFDYNGIKYSQKDSPTLTIKLLQALDDINDSLKENDRDIFRYFLSLEQKSSITPRLISLYKAYFDYEKEYESKIVIYNEMSEKLNFVRNTVPLDEIRTNFNQLALSEHNLKENIKLLMQDDRYSSEITKEMKDNFEVYLSRDWRYVGYEDYNNKNLGVLFTALDNYSYLLLRGYFLHKKELLDYKASLIY